MACPTNEAARAAGVGFLTRPIQTRTFAGALRAYLGRRTGVAPNDGYRHSHGQVAESSGMSSQQPANRGKVLVIEDGHEAAQLVATLLRAESFEPVVCSSAAEGIDAMAGRPVAVVLDWGLPDRPGLEVCRDIRAIDQSIPIIFLTGRADEASVARGLDSGANDFIVKPFRAVEFIARIEAHLRLAGARSAREVRAPSNVETERFGDIEVDLLARTVSRGGQTVALGRHEFKLVAYLVENAGIAISRDQILEHVYGYASGNSTERIDALVKRVRTKLGVEEQLVSIPGYGFRWERRSRR